MPMLGRVSEVTCLGLRYLNHAFYIRKAWHWILKFTLETVTRGTSLALDSLRG